MCNLSHLLASGEPLGCACKEHACSCRGGVRRSRVHNGAGLCALTRSCKLIDYPSSRLIEKHRGALYVNISTSRPDARNPSPPPHQPGGSMTHGGAVQRSRKRSGCNYTSTEHQVPVENTRPRQASCGSHNAPGTEAYSSGLCLFIWKCYSPLSSAVRKRPLFSPRAPAVTFVPSSQLPQSLVCLGNSAPVWLAAEPAAPLPERVLLSC